jgi:hypothetical protein
MGVGEGERRKNERMKKENSVCAQSPFSLHTRILMISLPLPLTKLSGGNHDYLNFYFHFLGSGRMHVVEWLNAPIMRLCCTPIFFLQYMTDAVSPQSFKLLVTIFLVHSCDGTFITS